MTQKAHCHPLLSLSSCIIRYALADERVSLQLCVKCIWRHICMPASLMVGCLQSHVNDMRAVAHVRSHSRNANFALHRTKCLSVCSVIAWNVMCSAMLAAATV